MIYFIRALINRLLKKIKVRYFILNRGLHFDCETKKLLHLNRTDALTDVRRQSVGFKVITEIRYRCDPCLQKNHKTNLIWLTSIKVFDELSNLSILFHVLYSRFGYKMQSI